MVRASYIVVKFCAVQGHCPLDKLPLLIIDVQVLTWLREHGPDDTPLDIGALEDVLLLVADAYRHVLEADVPDGDDVAAMSADRHPNTPPMDSLERYVRDVWEGCPVISIISMLVVVNLYHNPSTDIVKSYVAIGDVPDVAASSCGSLYPHTSP